MTVLRGLQRVQGRAVVVVSPDDAAGGAAAEAYLRVMAPPGSAAVVAPGGLSRAVVGGAGAVALFCSDVSKHLEAFDMALLGQCLSKLRPGGLVLAELGRLTGAQAAELEMTGLFAGAEASRVLAKAEAGGGLVDVTFSCLKPAWEAGAAADLPGAIRGATAAAASGKIDEDALLGEVPAPVGKGKSDCSSAPKACANCSCGRKELEEQYGAEEAKKKLEQGTVRSACGSCNLGDAFRCATCPYRGQPAFKPGSKVELDAAESGGTGQLDMRVEAEEVATAADGRLTIEP